MRPNVGQEVEVREWSKRERESFVESLKGVRRDTSRHPNSCVSVSSLGVDLENSGKN